MSNIFNLDFIGDTLVVQSAATKTNSNNINVKTHISQQSNGFTLQPTHFKQFDDFFKSFQSDVFEMKLSEKQRNQLYNLCKNLVSNVGQLAKDLLGPRNACEPSQAVEDCIQYIIDQLSPHDSKYKRQKNIEKQDQYVKPQEIRIGKKWSTVIHPKTGIPEHFVVPTTYQYVSIVDTIRSKFSNVDFFNMYTDFNENSHECLPGFYEYFCCGNIGKTHHSKSTIQIRIGVDEFEPCDALKSKTGLHKIYAIYFEIVNIPAHIKSKLNNIFLIALIECEDLKDDDEAMDRVLRKIVEELQFLETDGIFVGTSNLKARLINISGDNLGANGILGLVECFRATYFCRFCESTNVECQKAVREDSKKMRKEEDYMELVNKIDPKKRKFIESKGVKKFCVFNELRSFHSMRNFSADVMHDLLEGIVPFFINIFITQACDIKPNVINLATVQSKIRNFLYGPIWTKYKPSLLNINKNNLNQNSMQSYCLMIHLPYIFLEYKPKLEKLWSAMENLLQTMQIVFLSRISDSDIKNLESCIEAHLKYIVDELKLNLIAKHHFLVHYPNLIKNFGPVIHNWMMRFESKHRFFTILARKTNNYKNLVKTLAKEHQMSQCLAIPRMESEIITSKFFSDVSQSTDYDKYSHHLDALSTDGMLFSYDFVICEEHQFKPGLLLLHEKKVFEIIHLIKKDDKIFVFCILYKKVKFNEHVCSVEIKVEDEPNKYHLISFENIQNKKPHDKKVLNRKNYVLADTLDVTDGM